MSDKKEAHWGVQTLAIIGGITLFVILTGAHLYVPGFLVVCIVIAALCFKTRDR